MDGEWGQRRGAIAPASQSTKADWSRALQKVAAIETRPKRTLAVAFEEMAIKCPMAVAVMEESKTWSYHELARRADCYAGWAVHSGLRKGDVLALLMGNSAEYAAVWLGLTRVGVVVALLNVNLPATALARCLGSVGARHLIASKVYSDIASKAIKLLDDPPLSLYICDEHAFEIGTDTPLPNRDITLSDTALYIYTSGTTGLPKPALVTHRRLLYWSLWFSGLADIGPEDRLYACLPMYHSVGGVVAIFAPLLSGGSLVLRERFSVSSFWADVADSGCTIFQYIGELCRYLLNAPDCEEQHRHQLRLALGNGLQHDVWEPFQRRFAIPRILEFYAATESNFSLYNVEGKPGAIGRIPAFLPQASNIVLVRFDCESQMPARGPDGLCIRCSVGEVGEAIAKIDASTNEFRGYVEAADTERKILREIFEKGDAWMRSGDLMTKDAEGFYYFVDRIGDSFRWKGENVSTIEVAQALAACAGVREATVFGVSIPGHEGRAGMAALVVGEHFDLAGLQRGLEAKLPPYARPLFLRFCAELEFTGTYKLKKQALAEEGYDPERILDEIYIALAGAGYVRLDSQLFRRICRGEIKL